MGQVALTAHQVVQAQPIVALGRTERVRTVHGLTAAVGITVRATVDITAAVPVMKVVHLAPPSVPQI